MKINIFFIFIVFTILPINMFARWSVIPIFKETNASIKSIHEYSGDTIFVYCQNPPAICFSYDKGKTWDWQNFRFVDDNRYDWGGKCQITENKTIWVSATKQSGEDVNNTKYFSFSTDMGKSWIKKETPIPLKAAGFDFLDNDFCIVTQYKNQVWKTENAGDDWVQVSSPSEDGENLLDVLVLSKDIWLVVDTYNLWCFRTTDGGITWDKALEDTPVKQFDRFFNVKKDNGTILISTSLGYLYLSNDQGETFKKVEISSDVPLHVGMFLNQKQGWATESYEGRIYYTDDGGETWTEQYNIHENAGYDYGYCAFNNIHMFDENNGFAGGDSKGCCFTKNNAILKDKENNTVLQPSLVQRGERFRVVTEELLIQKIEIYNLNGQLIIESIDRELLAPYVSGMYFVKITTIDGKIEYQKLLVQ